MSNTDLFQSMTKAIKVFSEECKTSPGLALAFRNVSNENIRLKKQIEELIAETNRLKGKLEAFKEMREESEAE